MTYAAGDFLVLHGTGFFDRLIQIGTRSRWNHAALIVDDHGGIVEALSTGLSVGNVSKYANADSYHVAVALPDLDRFQVGCFAAVMAGRHARYGWLQIAAIVLRLFTGGRLVLKLDGTFICSSLVGRALEHGGLIWPKDADLLTPQDLLVVAQSHPQLTITRKP